jgi:hypothetical protein
MRSIRFGDFLSGQSTDAPEEVLYVLRSHVCLYVGISRTGIWERWFDPDLGHIRGCMRYGASAVGAYVLEHLPFSLVWTIEFWTDRDCRQFLFPDGRYQCGSKIEELESLMIKQLKPALNIIHNQGRMRKDDDFISAFYKTLTDD